MSVDVWTPDQCPRCRVSAHVTLEPGLEYCTSCQYEWRPAETSGPLDEASGAVIAGAGVPPTAPEDAPAVAALEEPLAAARSRYLGATVRIDSLDVEGVVSEISDDGYMWVTLADGYDCPCLPDEFTVVDGAVIPDETIAAIAQIDMTIAAQIMRVAAASIEGVGEGRRMTMPPEGWLPDDADVMPVIEHGAGYAVGYVAIIAGVSNEDLLSLADRLDEAAAAAKGANNP